MAAARKCDQPDCMAFVHPGCMVPCLGETFKPLWTKKWFCDEHLPSRRGSAAAAAAATATVKQPAKVAAAATAKTKTFADLQTGIEIAAVEDCAQTMRILGENLILLGEQTVAAQKQAKKDYEKTVAAQKLAEKDYEKTAEQLANALAQLQEAKKKVEPTPLEKLQDTVDAWTEWLDNLIGNAEDGALIDVDEDAIAGYDGRTLQ